MDRNGRFHGGRGGHEGNMWRSNLQPHEVNYTFIPNPTPTINYVHDNETMCRSIQNLIYQRANHRYNRNFTEADRLGRLLRDKFAVMVSDTNFRSGTWQVNEGLWRKISDRFGSNGGQRMEEHREQHQREEEHREQQQREKVLQQQHEVETENEISYPADAEEDMIPDDNEYVDGGENVNNLPHDSIDNLVDAKNDDGGRTEMMEIRPSTTTMGSSQKKATIATAGSAEQNSDNVSWPDVAQRRSSRRNIFKGTLREPNDSINDLLKSKNNNNVSNDTKGSSSKRRVTRQQSSRQSSFETKTDEDDDETGKKKMRISNSNNNVDISETTPLKQQITDLEFKCYLEMESTPVNNESKRDDTSISSTNSINSDDSYIYDLSEIFIPNNPTNISLSNDELNIQRFTHKLQQLKNTDRSSEEEEQFKKYNSRLYNLCPEVKRGNPEFPQFVPNRNVNHIFSDNNWWRWK
jgi:hypothetical protein